MEWLFLSTVELGVGERKNSTVSGLFLSRPAPTSSQTPDFRQAQATTATGFLFRDISFCPDYILCIPPLSVQLVQCAVCRKEKGKGVPNLATKPRPNCCISAKVHHCQCPSIKRGLWPLSILSFEARPPLFPRPMSAGPVTTAT